MRSISVSDLDHISGTKKAGINTGFLMKYFRDS